MWSSDSNEFAIRESPSVVKLYRNFQVGFAKPVFFVIVVWVQYAVRTVIPYVNTMVWAYATHNTDLADPPSFAPLYFLSRRRRR